MAGIVRVTMFKIPLKENQLKVLELYKTLVATATKDGKPYIVSLAAGLAMEDARTQGFTVVSKSEFKSLEDMRYYDDECEAHQTLKAAANKLGYEQIMTVYYTPAVVSTL